MGSWRICQRVTNTDIVQAWSCVIMSYLTPEMSPLSVSGELVSTLGSCLRTQAQAEALRPERSVYLVHVENDNKMKIYCKTTF